MHLASRIPSTTLAALAAASTLLAANVGCRTRDVAVPGPERVVYVNAPSVAAPNPQTMVADPTPPPPQVANASIPVQPQAAPAASPPSAASAQPQVVETYVVSESPPAPVVETIVPSPGPTYVWVGGRWTWRDRWVWAPGYWAPRPWTRAVWVEGHWVRRRHDWIWVQGHWR